MVQNEHKCNICGATFDNERDLQKHNRTTHALYQCDACGRTFESESALRNHYWIFHPEDTPVR